MQRRLLYKFGDWQEKYEADDKRFSAPTAPNSFPGVSDTPHIAFQISIIPGCECIARLPRGSIRCCEEGLPAVKSFRVTGG
jgi:hypothetical protein